MLAKSISNFTFCSSIPSDFSIVCLLEVEIATERFFNDDSAEEISDEEVRRREQHAELFAEMESADIGNLDEIPVGDSLEF